MVQPKIGNAVMANTMNKFVKDYWRVTTEGDPVPDIPAALVFAKCMRFFPALYIGSWRCVCNSISKDACVHDLQLLVQLCNFCLGITTIVDGLLMYFGHYAHS